VSLTTLFVHLHMYATRNKVYGKMCSSKHCSENTSFYVVAWRALC